MRNAFLFVLLSCTALITNATKVQSFSDNETLTLELSKTNYNRLFVTNDTIDKVRFPEKTFALEYASDGSVYLDLLREESITVFVSTKAGHNFSLNITPSDSLGQTIQLTPNTPSNQASQTEKKTPHEEMVTQLIQAMMNNQMPEGYGVKSKFSSYRALTKELSYKVSKQVIGNAYIGEVITVYNLSGKPITLDETWFKGNDTRAVALSKPTIAPKAYETIYVVKESAHA